MSTFTYNEEKYPLPKGKWENRTPEDLYDDVEKLDEESYSDLDEEEQLKLLKKNGFETRDHFDAYRSWVTSKVDFMARAQKKMNETLNATRQQMKDNADAMANTEVMAPISGVSLEQYAHINAQMAQGKDQNELLKQYGIEYVSWEKASEGWLERMRTDSSFTVSTEYSRHFMNAGQGQFASISKESAGALYGEESKSKNPVSLERYAEIMAAQGAAVTQGKDVNELLASYGLNAADWGAIGIHWSNQMMTDMQVGMKFGELYSKWTEKFSAETPGIADDINF